LNILPPLCALNLPRLAAEIPPDAIVINAPIDDTIDDEHSWMMAKGAGGCAPEVTRRTRTFPLAAVFPNLRRGSGISESNIGIESRDSASTSCESHRMRAVGHRCSTS
jgi:hypothetical protein